MHKQHRIVGRHEVEVLAAKWVHDMSQGDTQTQAQIFDGPKLVEFTEADLSAISALIARIVRLAHAGNPTKFEDVKHPEADVAVDGLIAGLKTRAHGVLPSSVTPHLTHAVCLNSGVWVSTVLGFNGLHDDIMFGPIVWKAPYTRRDWRMTAYSF